MAAVKWLKAPFATDEYRRSGAAFEALWDRLHRGDREPLPQASAISALARRNPAFAQWLKGAAKPAELAHALQEAWRAFHAGDFGHAIELGGTLGPLGTTVASKAVGVYATFLERDNRRGVELLRAAAAHGEQAIALLPGYANAHYMHAFVLGRYSQKISVVKALAEGHARHVRASLERALELEPKHADAHLGLGLFNAEIVGKLGGIAARVTWGASASAAERHFERALALAPGSAVTQVEYAQGLQLLDPRRNAARARELFRSAAAIEPQDAMERLYALLARSEAG